MPPGSVLSNDFLVNTAVTAAYYIPDFITVEEEGYLIHKIEQTPKLRWKTLGNRRLQLWGGEVLPNNVLVRKEMPPFLTTFPDIIRRLKETRAFESSPHKEPNHVILNEYLPGQGIMVRKRTISPQAYQVYVRKFDRSLIKTTPSDVIHAIGRVIHPTPVLSMFLEPRSVIITTGDLYASHLHGIDGVTSDVFLGDGRLLCPSGEEVLVSNWQTVRAEGVSEVLRCGGTLCRRTRFSLTCRDVERVAQLVPR